VAGLAGLLSRLRLLAGAARATLLTRALSLLTLLLLLTRLLAGLRLRRAALPAGLLTALRRRRRRRLTHPLSLRLTTLFHLLLQCLLTLGK
jgi:hypothetical protein